MQEEASLQQFLTGLLNTSDHCIILIKIWGHDLASEMHMVHDDHCHTPQIHPVDDVDEGK